MVKTFRSARPRATSILGEALEAGATHLASQIHSELGKPLAAASQCVATSLGFRTWDELSRNALLATSRTVDPRLLPLMDMESDEQFAARLARAMGEQQDRLLTVVRRFREGGAALAC